MSQGWVTLGRSLCVPGPQFPFCEMGGAGKVTYLAEPRATRRSEGCPAGLARAPGPASLPPAPLSSVSRIGVFT